MWKNYLTVAMRALTKNRTYAFINIFGLSIGLAACLMILVYVRYETSYDAWLPNSENSYQLQNYYLSKQTGEESHYQTTSYVAGRSLEKDFPQIERSVFVLPSDAVIKVGSEILPAKDVQLADDLFFDVLRFPLVQGDPATALARAGSAVLTESEARRIYGTSDAVGKTLTMVLRGVPTDYRVTGIARDVPGNSHVRFTIVARFDPATHFAENPQVLTSWGAWMGWYYFSLRPGSDPDAIRAALPAWERRNIPDMQFGEKAYNPGEEQDWRVVNIRDVHLSGARDGLMTPGNDSRTITTFAVVALLILAMASINFINLATARASQRSREVALRKVLGARRKQLVVQFLGESLLITGVAMLFALVIAELSLPHISAFLSLDLNIHYFGFGGLLAPVLGLFLIVGVAGGLYPAFYLSSYQPATVLKANKSSPEAAGTGRLRNLLVVGQFSVSIGLMVCTMIIYLQTAFAQAIDPGYRREGLIQIENLGRPELSDRMDAIVEQIERTPGVVSAGRAGIGIGTNNRNNFGVQVPGQSEALTIGNYSVDADFFPTMGIRLLAGRLFDEGRAGDDSTQLFSSDAPSALVQNGVNVVVNELATRRMGFRNPADAVGKQVLGSYLGPNNELVPIRIIGVVGDSRFRSIREPVDPIVFRYHRGFADILLVRYAASDPQAVRQRIERVWKRVAPTVPFDGQFIEDRVSELYLSEQARSRVFAGFSTLAVLIACLGLFGLAAFTAERRTKEIGIRKVFGATVPDIVKLLAWQFSKPVVLANLLAWPVAWWAMRDWLNSFDARIALTPGPFLIAGVLAVLIAVGTVAGHAIRVARMNPIHALRYE